MGNEKGKTKARLLSSELGNNRLFVGVTCQTWVSFYRHAIYLYGMGFCMSQVTFSFIIYLFSEVMLDLMFSFFLGIKLRQVA